MKIRTRPPISHVDRDTAYYNTDATLVRDTGENGMKEVRCGCHPHLFKKVTDMYRVLFVSCLANQKN